MSTVAASVRWAALVALLGGCEGARGCRAARPTGAAATPPVAAPASGDGGTRIMRTLAEIPPLGPSADGTRGAAAPPRARKPDPMLRAGGVHG